MKTTKPISTVSFNSEPFLRLKLDELLTAGKIDFWVYIKHFPEGDQKKEHFHVYVEPCESIDLTAIRNQFVEPVTDNEKPLGTLRWQKSKTFSDWYYYGLHDRVYLLLSGKKLKKYEYDKSEMRFSDLDQFEYYVSESVRGNEKTANIIEAMQILQSEGGSFDSMLVEGIVPLGNVNNFRIAWESLVGTKKKE